MSIIIIINTHALACCAHTNARHNGCAAGHVQWTALVEHGRPSANLCLRFVLRALMHGTLGCVRRTHARRTGYLHAPNCTAPTMGGAVLQATNGQSCCVRAFAAQAGGGGGCGPDNCRGRGRPLSGQRDCGQRSCGRGRGPMRPRIARMGVARSWTRGPLGSCLRLVAERPLKLLFEPGPCGAHLTPRLRRLSISKQTSRYWRLRCLRGDPPP